MKTIQLRDKEYPIVMGNPVYEAIMDETGQNPFEGGINFSNPKVIRAAVTTGVNEAERIKGVPITPKEELISAIDTKAMFHVAKILGEDLAEAMEYSKKLLEEAEKDRKK